MKQEQITEGQAKRIHNESVDRNDETLKNVGKTATEELKKDLDDLLDEIDEVLYENAEQFVSEFIQGGGQ